MSSGLGVWLGPQGLAWTQVSSELEVWLGLSMGLRIGTQDAQSAPVPHLGVPAPSLVVAATDSAAKAAPVVAIAANFTVTHLAAAALICDHGCPPFGHCRP